MQAVSFYHRLGSINNRLCQITFLKLFNFHCRSAGFFTKNTNIVTFLWVGEPTPGSDLPTEKVTLTTP